MMQRRTLIGRLILPAMAVAMLATVVAASPTVMAQEATPVSNSTSSTISVPGEGTISLAPDAASATVGVTNFDADLATAQTTADTQIAAIIEAIKAAGVSEDDIQTTGYSVSVMQNYGDTGIPMEVTGYQVSNMVNFTVRPVDQLGAVLDAAVTAGANTVWGVNFLVEDSVEAANQARVAAVADAKARADVLAEAAGMKVGDVISITEVSGPSALPASKEGAASGMGGGGTSIQPGQNTIVVYLQVVYELIPA